MKLKFKNQQFQVDAAKAVTDVFHGQPNSAMQEFTHDEGSDRSGQISFLDVLGYRNHPIEISYSQVLDNIRNIQMAAQLKPTESFDKSDLRLTIEMETGTGKTYTYIKTMYELNKLYGWSKFIIVVPSIAIREGVCKSFEVMSEHFAAEYGKRIQSFVYDSDQLTKIDQFACDSNMYVMIINTQAFNKDFKEVDSKGEKIKGNKIFDRSDAFRSRAPIDVIAATNPILIIDEPQSVLGVDKKNKTRQGLKKFNPLFTLLYSATHRADDIVNMVYRLDAMDAYNKKLVKKISVVGVEQKGTTATNHYLYLESIELSEGNPKARIGFHIRTGAGTKPVTKLVSDGFDIYQNSGELQEYEDGYRILSGGIDGYNRCIHLQNGQTLYEGDIMGAVNELLIRRAQIRSTILAHIEKERKLFHMGIKCLSLFFIDHVDNYRKYEAGGTQNGVYADIFEEEYANIVGSLQLRFGDDPKYIEYLKGFTADQVHNGYFSRDKKTGQFKQLTESKMENDESAYDLIMKDKERLLSFMEPTRFIFSHSALKEGWDNPNVFQICTLKDSSNDDPTKKRQEVGRGMRLCVNQNGERQDENVLHGSVFDVNELTIIASESYKSFASKLQTAISEAVGDRPQKVNTQLFLNLVVTNAKGEQKQLLDDDAQELTFTLRSKGYITKDGQLTPKYHEDKKEGTLDFGEYNEYKADVVKKLDTVFNPDAVKPEDARKVREAKFDSKKFERKEFQELWKRINHQTYYTVDFKTDDLIDKAVVQLNNHLNVSDCQLRIVTGEMDRIGSKELLTQGAAMKVIDSQTLSVHEKIGNVRYDLIGKLVEGTGLTRKAIVTILKKINPATFEQFKTNSEEFIIKASNIINECKAISVIEHVAYHKLDKQFESNIFNSNTLKGKLGVNALESKKSLYDLVVVDSAGIEMNFAKDLEERNEVAVYTKLPGGFYINTPVGHYNPDWAIVFKEGPDIKHIYFVAETKGSLEESQLREIEKSKIDCARKHFATIADSSVTYSVVRNYEDLRNILVK